MVDNDAIKMMNSFLIATFESQPNLPTQEEVKTLIKDYRGLTQFKDIDDETAEKILRDFEANQGISMNMGAALTSAEYIPWLNAKKSEIDFYYWERFKQYFLEKVSMNVFKTVDQETDRIVGFLQDPELPGIWDRRGLVMGHVQSGKTGNYTGVINKAADAGYKIIIVVAGLNNNLREQTQERLDEGFIGLDSSKRLSANPVDKYIGVGLIDKKRFPSSLTTSVRDFNIPTAKSQGIPLHNMMDKEPVVFVIKKHPDILENLIKYLKFEMGQDRISAPMLLIDDEADNASINLKYGKGEVSRINSQLRELIAMFERSCYVGYTATPFANIFIDQEKYDDQEDLFPRDFIVCLDVATNYVGPDQIFLDPEKKLLLDINDNQDSLPIKHKIDHPLTAIPQSLKTAVRQFVVARAIRLSRGQTTAHCSMLVNASIYNDVQYKIWQAISDEVSDIQASVKIYGALPSEEARKDIQIASLYEAWEDYYSDSEKDWHKIQSHLNSSAAAIKVIEVNGNSKDSLKYSEYKQTGLTVIAVGGYSLSRGLTLEGLMVSYYLRRSVMYDTLMQMGRWFGYRDGYADLCRIWMPDETSGWYEHISETIILLRKELRDMAAAGATPSEFGLKVRSHPDVLMITARNKMGRSEKIVVDIGLGGELIETYLLRKTENDLNRHRELARNLIKDISQNGAPVNHKEAYGKGYLYKKVDSKHIINFLSGFNNHPASFNTETSPVIRYIEDRIDNELKDWDVLAASNQKKSDKGGTDVSLGININCQFRTMVTTGIENPKTDLKISNNSRVSSRTIEEAGLSEIQSKLARRKFKQDQILNPELKHIPGKHFRYNRTRPLLMIHMIKVISDQNIGVPAEPVVAWGISFPKTDMPEKLTTFVCTTNYYNKQYEFEIAGGEDFEMDD